MRGVCACLRLRLRMVVACACAVVCTCGRSSMQVLGFAGRLLTTSIARAPHFPSARHTVPACVLAHPRYVIYEVDQAAPGSTAGAGTSDRTTRRRLLAEIPRERPSYMHSFGITARYIVLSEWAMR